MTQHRTRVRRTVWIVLLAAAVTAAAGAAGATAGNSGGSKRMATLKHQVATLKAQVKRLDAFSPAGIERRMANTKKALDKYQDVAQAEAAGYKAESPCEATPIDADQTSYGGAMGIHFVNDRLLASGTVDAEQPPILVYAPQADGSLKLVAAEYFKLDADQDTSTDSDRPSLFGRAFDGPMDGHAPPEAPTPIAKIHYDLHVWFWQRNPSGTFAPWNRDVTCPAK